MNWPGCDRRPRPGRRGARPCRPAGARPSADSAGQHRPVAPARPLLAPEAGGTRQHARRIAGLAAAALELVLYALAAGRAAALGRRPQILIAASAAVLGLAMIGLTVFVLTHLH